MKAEKVYIPSSIIYRQMAEHEYNETSIMKKIIIVVLALSVVLGVAFWKFAPNFFGPKEPVVKDITLTVYGLWEAEDLLKPAFEEYKKIHPNVTIKYELQRSINYRSRLQTKIANNEGPDIFIIHNSWLPMFLKTGLLAPMPSTLLSYADFGKSFYPIVKDTMSSGGKVYALPRGIDGLALFYNTELLDNAAVSVPKNWKELADAAATIAVSGPDGKLATAGVALGTTNNVDHWSDIVGLLFMQMPGASLEKPNNAQGAEVLKFYTDFLNGTDVTNKKVVWDKTMSSSTEEFARGRLAFYIAPSWRASELRTRNPQLKFGIAPIPQLPNQPVVGWGTFWGYSVSATSANQQDAWEFINFLASSEMQKALYQQAASARLFGLPFSRTELQKEVQTDPMVGPFVNQGPIYKSWYLNSGTFDQGLNDNIIKYYEDAINGIVNEGKEPEGVLSTLEQGVDQVLSEYKQQPAAPAQ